MATVNFVKKARRAVPSAGIAVGDAYYWWAFRYGGKHYSKTKPRRSQLTQSEFLSTIYDIEDEISAVSEIDEGDALDFVNRMNDLLSETQNNFDNMKEGLQNGDVGAMMEQRIAGLEQWIAEIEGIDWETTSPEEAQELIEQANPATWE
jgi:hypothetical protein